MRKRKKYQPHRGRGYYQEGGVYYDPVSAGALPGVGGVSVEGYQSTSPDRFNTFNVIPSNQITMQGVPHPVLGIDDTGAQQLMWPGVDYQFPGQAVLEIPLRRWGGPLLYQHSGRKKGFSTLGTQLKASGGRIDGSSSILPNDQFNTMNSMLSPGFLPDGYRDTQSRLGRILGYLNNASGPYYGGYRGTDLMQAGGRVTTSKERKGKVLKSFR